MRAIVRVAMLITAFAGTAVESSARSSKVVGSWDVYDVRELAKDPNAIAAAAISIEIRDAELCGQFTRPPNQIARKFTELTDEQRGETACDPTNDMIMLWAVPSAPSNEGQGVIRWSGGGKDADGNDGGKPGRLLDADDANDPVVGNEGGRFELRMTAPERIVVWHSCATRLFWKCVGQDFLELRRVTPKP